MDVRHGIDTGITFGAGMLPGMVPDYDVMAARVRVGLIENTQWNAMHWREKARVVAFYRIERLISLHSEEAKAEAEIRFLQNKGMR